MLQNNANFCAETMLNTDKHKQMYLNLAYYFIVCTHILTTLILPFQQLRRPLITRKT